VHDGLGLYVVADGASDGPAGEVASRTAIAALEEFVADVEAVKGGSFMRSFASKGTGFEALRVAMRAVIDAAEEHEELDGMATTVTMLLAHGDRAVACHVGDSRLYLVRGGILRLLTADDELAVVPAGHSADAYHRRSVQCFSMKLWEGDTFLLCTDGAEDVIEDSGIVDDVSDLMPRDIAQRIVATARRVDPDRDATVVVVRVRGDQDDGWLLVSAPVRPWAYGATADLEYAG